ncbi:hypothetical protein EGT69_011420 [Acinetobacter junii]|uniref:Uncharacterized protein n=1 Tax=Acinetobacter junii TaxID=40215 RepID=A0A8F6R4H2_ACIJU|nr:hypothetical protein [Acinetobacter junii]MDH1005650.1 hypothetical protein [Acinetobacter junii]QXR29323.1 hypothetical protein EGT69_011420 [Acinetobacter junii]
MSLSYTGQHGGAWQTYLTQIDRVAPYLDADLSNFTLYTTKKDNSLK